MNYSVAKKYEIMSFESKWVYLEIAKLSAINKEINNSYQMFSLVCAI